MKMGSAIPYCMLAAMKRRLANKRPCPCGSGRRLGRCHNRRVNTLRNQVGRLVLVNEMQIIVAAFRDASSRKTTTEPAKPAAGGLLRAALSEIATAPINPPWVMPRGQAPAARTA